MTTRFKWIPPALFLFVLVVGILFKFDFFIRAPLETESVPPVAYVLPTPVPTPPPLPSPTQVPSFSPKPRHSIKAGASKDIFLMEEPPPVALPKAAPVPYVEEVPAIITGPSAEELHRYKMEENTFWARILFSCLSAFAGLVIVLGKSKFHADSVKWAYGILGTILGYWLK